MTISKSLKNLIFWRWILIVKKIHVWKMFLKGEVTVKYNAYISSFFLVVPLFYYCKYAGRFDQLFNFR